MEKRKSPWSGKLGVEESKSDQEKIMHKKGEGGLTNPPIRAREKGVSSTVTMTRNRQDGREEAVFTGVIWVGRAVKKIGEQTN